MYAPWSDEPNCLLVNFPVARIMSHNSPRVMKRRGLTVSSADVMCSRIDVATCRVSCALRSITAALVSSAFRDASAALLKCAAAAAGMLEHRSSNQAATLLGLALISLERLVRVASSGV